MLTLSMLVVVVVSLLLAHIVGSFLWKYSSLRRFPGPVPLPLVGNMYTAEAFAFLKYFAKLRKRYGKWYVFWSFSQPFLVCCDPPAVREVLSDTKTFVKGSDYTKTFGLGFGQGLVTSVGEKHKKDRSRVGKYFTKSSVCQYLDKVNFQTSKAINTMIGDIGEQVHDRQVDLEYFFARLTLRVFGEFCMHHDFGESKDVESTICHSVSQGSFYIGLCIGTGLPQWRGLPWTEFIISAKKHLIGVLTPIVQKRREAIARHAESTPDDPLTAMLVDDIPQDELEDHLVTLICAGHDTTAFFCSYMGHLLAKHADVQDKLREEIISVMGDRSDVTEEDMNRLPFMRKVMQETLRLYTIIPAVTRVATKEVTFKESGVVVPKGTNVFIPMIVMNRDPELWQSPEKFMPERWDDAGVFQNPKLGYLPFGYGSRSCMGGNLATVESTVFLCQILRRYKLEPAPGFKPSIRAGISLTTNNGMKVRVTSL